MLNGTKPLPPRQELFIEKVLDGRSMTDAYVQAGYSPQSANRGASRLAAQPRIAHEIESRKASVRHTGKMERSEMLDLLAQLARDRSVRPSDRIRAIAQYAKMTGQEASNRSRHDATADDLRAMSDDELKNHISQHGLAHFESSRKPPTPPAAPLAVIPTRR